MGYIRGIIVFVLISSASIVLLFIWYDISFDFFLQSLLHIHVGYILCCVGLVFFYVALDALRTQVILHALHAQIPFFGAVYAGVANEFMSALTPFQSGGQAFEIYCMHSYAVPLSQSVIVAYFRMAANVFVLFAASVLTLLFMPELLSFPYAQVAYLYAAGFMLFFLSLTALMIYAPRLTKILNYRLWKILVRLKILKQDSFFKKLKHSLAEIHLFHRYIQGYYFVHYFYILAICVMTVGILCVKYLILAVLFAAVDISAPLMETLSFQAVIQFVNYAVPTPGASGSTEIFATQVLQILDDSDALKNSLPVLILLWRFFSYHSLVLLGAATIVKWRKKKDPQASMRV